MTGPAPLYLVLLHHPVLDRYGDVVTTSITNLDVHDIARSARTYGVRRYFVAHPVPALRALAERIVEHWRSGWGSRYNPSRFAAISLVEVVHDLDQAIAAVEQDSGRMPYLIATSARSVAGALPFPELAQRLETSSEPCLLVFGTGYGLTDEVLSRCEAQLEPVTGVGDYNHLSVRAAAAIVLDRLRTLH
ncbi:MAG: RNA methyltransferase [Deltaproteobacteria bacterium]